LLLIEAELFINKLKTIEGVVHPDNKIRKTTVAINE